MRDAECRSIGWLLALVVLIVGAAGLGSPTTGFAQQGAEGGDWEVEGGEKRRREVVERYKKLLEKKPTQGVIFEKLVEYGVAERSEGTGAYGADEYRLTSPVPEHGLVKYPELNRRGSPTDP